MTKYDKIRLSVLNYFTAQLDSLSNKENIPEDLIEEYRDWVKQYGNLGSEEQQKQYQRLTKKIFDINDPLRAEIAKSPDVASIKAFEIMSPMSIYAIQNGKDSKELEDMSIPQYNSIEELIEDSYSKGDYSRDKNWIKAIFNEEIDPEKVMVDDERGLLKKKDGSVIITSKMIEDLKRDLKHSKPLKNLLIQLLESYR